MKIKENSRFGSIIGDIHIDIPTLRETPKRIQLLDGKLRIKKSYWITGQTFNFDNVVPGLYVIKLSFTSGADHQQLINVQRNKTIAIKFDLTANYMLQYQERTIVNKVDSEGYSRTYFENVALIDVVFGVKLLSYNGHRWVSRYLTKITLNDVLRGVKNFDFETGYDLHLICIESPSFPSKLIRIPSNNFLNLSFEQNFTPHEKANPISVNIKTSNWVAEGILNLLTRGVTTSAEELYQVIEAEQLLYLKRQDHYAAAIGGYYLLKNNNIDKLHDWAENLCNWFGDLPDGAVIYAWQLISQQPKSLNAMLKIKSLLILAIGRGIPTYTEGVRLLYNGLKQLSSLFYGEDEEIEVALKILKVYVRHIDWTKSLTTLTGILNYDFEENSELTFENNDIQKAIRFLNELRFSSSMSII